MDYKSGFVSIVGRPNVGKSTILNTFIKEKVAITSFRPQTTRNAIRGILTTSDAQIIFIDTPGIHKPKSKLGEFMVSSAVENIGGVDVVLVVVEATSENNIKEDEQIIERVKKSNLPAILAINKVDLISKEKLLPLIDRYSKMMTFRSIIPISAKESDNLDAVISDIKTILNPGPKFFPEDEITDQPERVIVSEIIREKVLKNIQDEIPHGIGVDIISFKEREDKDLIEVQANIYCEKDTHKAIIIGKQGKMLKKIGSQARLDVEGFLKTKIYLEIWVKVKQDWRNNNFMLKSLGFKK